MPSPLRRRAAAAALALAAGDLGAGPYLLPVSVERWGALWGGWGVAAARTLCL